MNTLQKIGIAAASLGGIALMGAGVYAAVPNHPARLDSLVSAIATKFNLNKDDVQKVFDEQRDLNQQQMQAKRADDMKTRLDQAVKDGKLTQAQEDATIAKHQELQTFRESLKDKTPADRQTAMKTEMESIQQWAKDNSIPEQYMFGLGAGFGRGPMMGRAPGHSEGAMGQGWHKGMPPKTPGTTANNQ